MNKLTFSDKSSIPSIFGSEERRMVNFLNMHDIYQFVNEKEFNSALSKKENINFLDGFTPKLFICLLKFRRIRRMRGPTFTADLLRSAPRIQGKKIFIIGASEEDVNKLVKVFPNLNKKDIRAYNPPFIKGLVFDSKEISKMASFINSFKADYVFVCVGSPKQNILSSMLFPKTTAKLFFNVGAAMDFMLGKKKEAPRIVQSLGIEWLYRLITDFNYSKKKVLRSLVAIKYLSKIELI